MSIYYKTLLENKLLKSNGTEFQALFYKIMRYYYKGKFMEIKPYGNIGDRKCDGYVRKEGIFFQVYGPEEPNKKETISYAKKKLIKDFYGLYVHTQNNHYEIIKEFYYVFNNKTFDVITPIFDDELIELEEAYSDIKFGYKSNQDLLYYFMHCEDIAQKIILDLYTDFDNIQLHNDIISQVVGHLTNTVDYLKSSDKLILPDFGEKIKFNNLSEEIGSKLTLASYHIVILDEYLDTYQNTYIKDDLKNIFTKIYNDAIIKYPNDSDSDKQFYFILEQSIPNDIKDNANKLIFSQNILILMSKYFETCDIFKEPEMIMAFF